MQRTPSCPALQVPPAVMVLTAAASVSRISAAPACARRLVAARSMPDLLAAAIFVPPQRLLECAMRVRDVPNVRDVPDVRESAVRSQFMFSLGEQRGVVSAPDLAVCIATPDPMSSREEEDEGEEDEISRSLARTLAEERAGAVRRRQQQRMREGSSGACSGLRPRLASCGGVCYRCEAAPAQAAHAARQQPRH